MMLKEMFEKDVDGIKSSIKINDEGFVICTKCGNPTAHTRDTLPTTIRMTWYFDKVILCSKCIYGQLEETDPLKLGGINNG